MTIDKCEKCSYSKNVAIEYGDTILCCGKSNEEIIVSLKDHKTLKIKCPLEHYKSGNWVYEDGR